MSLGLGVVAILVLIAANALFVAVEFALVAVDRHSVEVDAESGSGPARRVLGALRQLSATLSSAQVGITLSSLLLGLFAEPVLAQLLEPLLGPVVGEARSAAVSLGLAFVVATAAQMVLGELVPKGIAIASPRATAERLARATGVMNMVFRPLTSVLDAAANRVVRSLGIEPREELATARSRQELSRLVEGSLAHGDIEGDEAGFLLRGLRFGAKDAAVALTPRTALHTIDSGATGEDLLALARSTGFSRFPVTNGSVDDIAGIVDIRTLLDHPQATRRGLTAGSLSRPALTVPESRKLASLLTELRSSGEHMAIVGDEYGGTAGVITVEDILEEVVGEIHDESDRAERLPRPGLRRAEFSGRAGPDEVAEGIGFDMPPGPYESLAGFMLNELGRIPVVGDGIAVDGWTFTVAAMDGLRIARVTVGLPAGGAHPIGGASRGTESGEQAGGGR